MWESSVWWYRLVLFPAISMFFPHNKVCAVKGLSLYPTEGVNKFQLYSEWSRESTCQINVGL